MAAAGIGSRRACEELIELGQVRVNGKVVDELPAFADPEIDEILVNEKPVKPAAKEYYLLNKPKGYICTNSDPFGRKKVIDLIPATGRVFCVGRLDADSTGAIIVTNDSNFANKLTHPSFEIPKTYRVHIEGRIEGPEIEKLKKGVWLSEGRTGRAAVKVLKRSPRETTLSITITQGMNRQVRRSLAKLGYKVKSLTRVSIGDLELRGLGAGKFKKLSEPQIKKLTLRPGT